MPFRCETVRTLVFARRENGAGDLPTEESRRNLFDVSLSVEFDARAERPRQSRLARRLQQPDRAVRRRVAREEQRQVQPRHRLALRERNFLSASDETVAVGFDVSRSSVRR